MSNALRTIRRTIARREGKAPLPQPKGPARQVRPLWPRYAAYFGAMPAWYFWFLLPTAKKRALEAKWAAEAEAPAPAQEVTP